jgi:hypothetical protein
MGPWPASRHRLRHQLRRQLPHCLWLTEGMCSLPSYAAELEYGLLGWAYFPVAGKEQAKGE